MDGTFFLFFYFYCVGCISNCTAWSEFVRFFFLAANFGKQWSSVKAVMLRNSSSTGTCQGEKMANQPILNFGPTPMECQIKG